MTSIEWLIEEMSKYGYAHTFKLYQKQVQQAKEMHKAELGKTWDAAIFRNAQGGYNASRTFEDFDDYYQETFVSKGSDDHISDISKMVRVPQQEISDEEIEKLANKHILYNDSKRQWVVEGMKLYRKHIKQKL